MRKATGSFCFRSRVFFFFSQKEKNGVSMPVSRTLSFLKRQIHRWFRNLNTMSMHIILLLFFLLRTGLSHWDLFAPWENQVAFPGESQLRQSRYPTYSACWAFKCFHNPPNSDMDYRIFNVRTDVSACDWIRGCTDTARQSALKVDWEETPLPHRGSNRRQQRAGQCSTNWATSSLPHFSSCLVLRYNSLCLGSPRGLSSLRVKLTKSRAGQCPQAGQYQIWAPDLKSLKSSENWYSQTMF